MTVTTLQVAGETGLNGQSPQVTVEVTAGSTGALDGTQSSQTWVVEVVVAGETGLVVVVVVASQSNHGSSAVVVVAGETGVVVVLSQSSHGSSAVVVVAGETGLVVVVVEVSQSSQGSSTVVVVDSQAKAEDARMDEATRAEVNLATILNGERVGSVKND